MNQAVRGRRQRNVCFHGIGAPQRPLEPGEDAYWVNQDQFEALLDEMTSWPDTALSFDDGNASDVELALPALTARGLTATFFVIAGRMDHPGSLSRGEVVSLKQHGMTIGSHGMRHRSWRGMDEDAATEELVRARQLLEEVVDLPVTEAACPLGLYDRRALSALRTAGYSTVYTSDRSWGRSGRWLQPRFSVTSSDSRESLRSQVLEAAPLHHRVRQGLVQAAKRLR